MEIPQAGATETGQSWSMSEWMGQNDSRNTTGQSKLEENRLAMLHVG